MNEAKLYSKLHNWRHAKATKMMSTCFININFIYFTTITTKETISYIEVFVGPDGGVSVVLEGGGNRSARGKPP